MLIVDGCNSDADANREDKDDDGDNDGVGQVVVYAKGRSYDFKTKNHVFPPPNLSISKKYPFAFSYMMWNKTNAYKGYTHYYEPDRCDMVVYFKPQNKTILKKKMEKLSNYRKTNPPPCCCPSH